MSYGSAKSSGLMTVGTTVVAAAPSLLCSVILNPGSAASTVTVYDNASTNSGTVLASLVAALSTNSTDAIFNIPIFTQNGITVVVAGTGATATVSFIRSY